MNAPAKPPSGIGVPQDSATSVAVLRGVSEIDTIRHEWQDLFERSGQPHQVFQSPAILGLWMRHYADAGREPIFVTGRLGGRLAVIIPLVRQRRFGLTVMRFMGLPIAQFCDCIAEPDIPTGLADELWSAVRKLGADVLDARRVRSDAALHGIAPAADFSFEPQQAAFANLKTRVSGNGDVGEAYSSRYRSNFRRRQRRFAELGKVDMVSNPSSPTNAQHLTIAAINMKRLWLQQNDLQSIAVKDDRFLAFFSDAAADPATGLQISAIMLDGMPTAIDLSFGCGGTCFGHVLAVDPERHHLGIGGMMVHQAFAAAKANGSTTFDLMAPLDNHKAVHADGLTPVASYAYAFTATGRLACRIGLGKALPVAKALASMLPPRLVNWFGRRLSA